MTSPGSGLLSNLLLFWRLLVESGWQALAALFDAAQNISAPVMISVILGGCALIFLLSALRQNMLNKQLLRAPARPAKMWRQELRFSIPYLLMVVVAGPILLVLIAVRALLNFVGGLLSKSDKPGTKIDDKNARDPSIVIATLGPSFMWSALIIAGIFGLSWALEPLLRQQLDLNPGTPAWQYLFLGSRAEMQWFLPLQRFKYLHLLINLVIWFGLWWSVAQIIRLWLRHDLGENLAGRVHDRGVLSSWRSWFGSQLLFDPDTSYKNWAKWLILAAIPFLAVAFGTLSAAPYRTNGAFFSVSLLLWLSWAIHLNLKGHWYLSDPEQEEAAPPEPPPSRGWADVLDDLRVRVQVEEPFTFQPPRGLRPLELLESPPDGALISALLAEIYPGSTEAEQDAGITHMQKVVLETLSRQAYVHVDPPARAGSLELGRVSGAGVEDESGLRHRNQLILAPDGSGKTTLAMLAACNHALTHTRATLLVTRDEASAEQFSELLRATLEPSTLRWTVRAKKASAGLVADLSQGIIPDIIVASLDQLTTSILAEPKTYAPFLKTLGLVIIDDAESFCGPIEIHAQLAFRRLALRVREVLGTRQLGEESAPVTLILSADSMHDTPAWLRSTFGVDAVTRTFDYAPDSADKSLSGSGLSALKTAPPGRYHLFYHLSDFTSPTGEALSAPDIIASLERLGLPWHYRSCGDARRHLGRQHLKLNQEPQHYVETPRDACVVFLEGQISSVRREIAHLNRAGSNFWPSPGADTLAAPCPVAFISIVDSDERMALTELNPNSSLADIVRTLPRPVVRAPFGLAVETHLAADLSQNWLEVADVLDVFGNTAVHTLSRLADNKLLLHESRKNLNETQTDYQTNLHVRVPLKAVASSEQARHRDGGPLLPPRVDQVERPPGPSVAVRDRTNLTLLGRTDRVSARHIYYPGRIFENALGRFVVVGVAGDVAAAAQKNSPVSENDILVEPFLNDEVSSPRRRTRVSPMSARQTLPGAIAPLGKNTSAAEDNIDSEPVFIGDFPVAFSLGPVNLTTRHLATMRLDAHNYQLRQRILFTSKQRRAQNRGAQRGQKKSLSADTLRTIALGIYPNPALEIVAEDDCPRLQVRDARLVAAAMRAVLPAMYRGVDSDIQVALHIIKDDARPDQELRPEEGFYLYDPHLGGNGSANAIHRDGVELLLRLCRVYLERVLYHDRLRARYDYWADPQELAGNHGARHRANTAQRALEADNTEENGDDEPLSERERDRRARRRALTWLDSRLRPEGSAANSRHRAHFGSGAEDGEGDIFDLGRCWYSVDGSVTDLIWTKHRWMLNDPAGDSLDAMCDVGIGRQTAAQARAYTADTPQLAAHLAWLERQLANPAFALEDETIWGNPTAIWALESGEDIPHDSDPALLEDEGVGKLHLLTLAVAAENFASLKPLAELLAARSGALKDAAGRTFQTVNLGDEAERRVKLARFMADFVQGIPYAPGEEPEKIFGPIHTLLYRLGNQESQSLLLAILLRHAEIDAGLFLEPASGRVLCAAALPLDPSAHGLAKWRARFARADERIIWAEMPSQPGTAGSTRAFIPIETARYQPLAQAELRDPSSWVFLPLDAAWIRAGIEAVDIPGAAR